jgi:hypothetical protein
MTDHRDRWTVTESLAPNPPAVCPTCGSPRVARILYGLPAFSEELERALQEGTVALGGCVVTGDDPDWRCLACGDDIYRATAESDGGRAVGKPTRRPRGAAKRPGR